MVNIDQMNFMIWSVALMYLYWMVIRDMMIPIAYSELVDKEFRDRLVKTSMTQSSVLGVFTYITALFFLAMYYYFANTEEEQEDEPELNIKNKRDSRSVTKVIDEEGEKGARNTKRASASIKFEELTSSLGDENQFRKSGNMQKYSVPI
jgi:hypothetical protein